MTEVQPHLGTTLRRGLRCTSARRSRPRRLHRGVNKGLIVHREWTPGSITVVLCDEALGASHA